MNAITNYSLINFGQKVPTVAMLECGLDRTNYDNYKELCLAIENKFPGKAGFRGQALRHMESIKNKNPWIADFIKQINGKERKEQREYINKFVSRHGKIIDVEI